MTKQYKDNITEHAQESLVDALENIKNLLEKSESKLSAARESIALANSSSRKIKNQADDEDIPVLEEEIIPTLDEEEIIPTLGDSVESDLLFDISSPNAPPTFDSPPEMPDLQGLSLEDVMELIDEFQDRLPASLNKTITNCSLASLENELFDALQKEINQLRNEIQQLDK